MQRVRIGVMGLAGVFLLVVLAAALYSLFGSKVSTGANAGGAGLPANSSEAPKEPLAELGVAPGNVPTDVNSAAPAPRAAPAANH